MVPAVVTIADITKSPATVVTAVEALEAVPVAVASELIGVD